MDSWRTVVVDDQFPTDLFGRPLCVGTRPTQLWPLLLSKAILKVMAAYRSLDRSLPHQVSSVNESKNNIMKHYKSHSYLISCRFLFSPALLCQVGSINKAPVHRPAKRNIKD